MSVLAWVGLGALAWIVAGTVVFCVREREARQAIAEFGLALALGPALLTVGWFLRSGAPRATPLTAEALERWARSQTGHTGIGKRERSAWVLSYRNHGLIVVRRRDRGSGWLNDVPNRTSRVRRESADRPVSPGGSTG